MPADSNAGHCLPFGLSAMTRLKNLRVWGALPLIAFLARTARKDCTLSPDAPCLPKLASLAPCHMVLHAFPAALAGAPKGLRV